MAIIYDDNSSRGGPPSAPYHTWNATNNYLKHYENSLHLQFFAQKGDRAEKQQASKELDIADRKMKYWQSHPNYDHKKAMEGAAKLKSQWGSAGFAFR